MNDLISRKKVLDVLNELDLPDVHAALPVSLMLGIVKKALEPVPSVPAVPLDKLCEWLARFGCPCEINDGMCDMSHGVDRCLGIFNSNSFCWKYLLTKWMEGLDGTD